MPDLGVRSPIRNPTPTPSRMRIRTRRAARVGVRSSCTRGAGSRSDRFRVCQGRTSAHLISKIRPIPSEKIAPFPIKEVGGTKAILERIVPFGESRSGSTESLLGSSRSGFDSTQTASRFDESPPERSHRRSFNRKRCSSNKKRRSANWKRCSSNKKRRSANWKRCCSNRKRRSANWK
jgi:hypothetical protein